MKQNKNFNKLTTSPKKQIKSFMEWGTGKNDINSFGIPEQMTIREKARYAIAMTVGVFVVELLRCGIAECSVIACIDVFVIGFLIVFMVKKDNLLIQTLVVPILEWNISILLYLSGWLKNTILILLLIHVTFTIGGLCTAEYCIRNNLYVNSEKERNQQKNGTLDHCLLQAGQVLLQ